MSAKDSAFEFFMSAYAALFAKKRWHALNKFFFNLALRGLGILPRAGDRCITAGEVRVLRALARQWDRTPTIIDVGAHHGDYSAQVRLLAPHARIYAFEPNPNAFQTLKERSAELGITPLNMACGERKDTLPLYDYMNAQGSVHASLHPDVITSLHRGEASATYVAVAPLHDFLQQEGIARVDLLKIDTEGHELMVLRGLQPKLSTNAIDVIQFEFNAMNIISRTFFRDFYLMLPQYDFFRIVPDGLIPLEEYQPLRCELYAHQNIFAVRRGSGIRL